MRALARPVVKGGGLAHGAQVGEQSERVLVADGDGVGVHDRQGEAGALQERGAVGGVDEGRDPRTRAAAHPRLGLGQALTQFGQGGAAEEGAQEKPVRLQRPPDLHQRAHEVVDPVQGEAGDHEIEAVLSDRQPLLVRHQARSRPSRQHRMGEVALDEPVNPRVG